MGVWRTAAEVSTKPPTTGVPAGTCHCLASSGVRVGWGGGGGGGVGAGVRGGSGGGRGCLGEGGGEGAGGFVGELAVGEGVDGDFEFVADVGVPLMGSDVP